MKKKRRLCLRFQLSPALAVPAIMGEEKAGEELMGEG